MLRFWIKPCMSLDAWFGSMKKHVESEIGWAKEAFWGLGF
jgi:hypothetical protein